MVIVFSFLSSGLGEISSVDKFCNFLIYPLIEPRVREIPFFFSLPEPFLTVLKNLRVLKPRRGTKTQGQRKNAVVKDFTRCLRKERSVTP